LRSITRRTEQNGLTSDKCLLSSSKSSFSAIELIHANTYVDESCNIPWRGYLLASSQRSCEQAPMLDNKSYIFGKVNYNYFHSTGSILTSWYLFIWSRNFPPFMEPEGSLSCSQQPAIGPHPKAVETTPYLHTLFL
jgi:hypothetical protein